ncbi:hypothetical protein L6164_037498 [Bauhinia variegata]|uniref:Uncharacterized protein n=1 Tax=Bauhinia variegata TaxID=167791 RepID=A0ACB9KK69_BAUVA|nr:hypothetical protein L6164_037498 [Bauhinia variegata]
MSTYFVNLSPAPLSSEPDLDFNLGPTTDDDSVITYSLPPNHVIAALKPILLCLGAMVLIAFWFAKRDRQAAIKAQMSSPNFVQLPEVDDVQPEFTESLGDSTSGGSNSYWYKVTTPIMRKYEIQIASS